MNQEVIDYRRHLDDNLLHLHNELLCGNYTFGNYHYFKIYDPKERIICASVFEERIVQHAMMRIIHPIFEKYQIYDSYACRVGKGTYKALERAMSFSAKYQWFAKLDVKKYFNSIDHGILMGQIERLIKDKKVLSAIEQLIGSYEIDSGKGLPIGNLSSQYFANHYLSVADHYALEHVHVDAIIRYMDDIILFGNDLRELKNKVTELMCFIQNTLRLQLHHLVINKTNAGLPCLGYVVYPHRLRLNQRSRHRFISNVKSLNESCNSGILTETECQHRFMAMLSFVQKAQCHSFLKRTSP